MSGITSFKLKDLLKPIITGNLMLAEERVECSLMLIRVLQYVAFIPDFSVRKRRWNFDQVHNCEIEDFSELFEYSITGSDSEGSIFNPDEVEEALVVQWN
jgi:hypothetical protein